MCGIAGLLDPERRATGSALEALTQGMVHRLRHRGPDAHGVWTEPEAGVALGHARLSIIDLSAAGAQPMASASGRYVLSYNGEVYNADELRTELELEGQRFRGHSDTEVIVEGFAAWGVPETVERLIGMFAFAVYDRKERVLMLVRDRLGIKPLYWGRLDGRIVFASELKAFAPLPGFPPEIDRDALASYICTGYVPAPASIYRGISKLEPGTMLEVRADGIVGSHSYWSALDVAVCGQSMPLKTGAPEAIEQLETLLTDAVTRRMVADVPLGVFLSGGIDSSTVAALMQAHSQTPIRSFSIGFHDPAYNEANAAKAVAQHLGTDHTELYVSATEAQSVVPKLPQIYDEPFADVSQIPTYLLSEMTRRHVTVALSGDGGDELFAGYNRYAQGLRVAQVLRQLPGPLPRALSKLISGLSPLSWESLFALLPALMRPRQAGDKLQKLAGVLGADPDDYYRVLVSPWAEAWALVEGAERPETAPFARDVRGRFKNELAWMQYADMVTYLPDDVLTKVDRASMAVSLEARVPLLDHRVVAFAWQLPDEFKIGRGQGKWLLRQLLFKFVPRALVERPKMGFGVPIDAWLRGPLKEWAEDLLDPELMAQAGYLDPEPIRARWREHLSGRRNWQHFLWNVLMFEAWRREYRGAAMH
jgi:asparagine synthase (glutamine-hydrolysing)